MLGDPVVDQQADDADGQHRNQYFEPELEGGEPLGAGLGGGERVELLEVEHDHRQNGAQLDDNIEHIHKLFGLVEV